MITNLTVSTITQGHKHKKIIKSVMPDTYSKLECWYDHNNNRQKIKGKNIIRDKSSHNLFIKFQFKRKTEFLNMHTQ